MKNFKQKIIGFALIAGALMCVPMNAIANFNDDVVSGEVVIAKDNLVGGWEYTVEGAPEGYDKGLMMIVNQSGTYKVQVQLNGGAINGSDVVVKGNNITFNVNVEGETVAVALEAKGSKMTGTSTSSSNGVMNITAIKSISPQ